MSGEGVFPFDPGRLAALGRLSATINAAAAPPPIAEPVLLDEHGRVLLPVPHFDPPVSIDSRSGIASHMVRHVWCQLHAGLTLQWQPMAEQGGLLVEFRGGSPDGDPDRDAATVFLTVKGLRGLIADLQAIDAALGADS